MTQKQSPLASLPRALQDLREQVLLGRNLIMTGAPGTGKTYLAQALACDLIGLAEVDELAHSPQFAMVQFHPSIDYTDFIEGLRPTTYRSLVSTQEMSAAEQDGADAAGASRDFSGANGEASGASRGDSGTSRNAISAQPIPGQIAFAYRAGIFKEFCACAVRAEQAFQAVQQQKQAKLNSAFAQKLTALKQNIISVGYLEALHLLNGQEVRTKYLKRQEGIYFDKAGASSSLSESKEDLRYYVDFNVLTQLACAYPTQAQIAQIKNSYTAFIAVVGTAVRGLSSYYWAVLRYIYEKYGDLAETLAELSIPGDASKKLRNEESTSSNFSSSNDAASLSRSNGAAALSTSHGAAALSRSNGTAALSSVNGAVPKFVFVIDEINRGELNKVLGELFFSLDPGYRGPKGKVKTQYQNLVPASDPFAEGFYVPNNVYVIGTMNDIDRSVSSMDLAMRRRFSWYEVKAQDNLSMLEVLADELPGFPNKVREVMTRLNQAIWNEELAQDELERQPSARFGLNRHYHIGGAYFLNLVKYLTFDEQGQWEQSLAAALDKLWENHLQGVLFEYVRGQAQAEQWLYKVKQAYLNQSSN